MATDNEQFEDADDDQLAWLLTSAHAAPEMRAEFAGGLAKRLDAEFAASRGAVVHSNGRLAPSSNGEITAGHAEAATQNGASDNAVSPLPRRERGRRLRRTMWLSATAAATLLTVSVMMDPAAWANVLRSVVESIGEFTIGGGDEQADSAVPPDGQQAQQPNPLPPADIAAAKPSPVQKLDVEIRSVEPAVEAAVEAAPPGEPKVEQPVVEGPKWEPFAEALPPNELSRRVDDQLAALWQCERHSAGRPGERCRVHAARLS